MANKPFSSSLYNDNDDAKNLVVKFFKNHDYEAWVNPDRYGIDIIFHDETFIYQYCEVEVKHNWKGEAFPYDTVHLPKRKLKFANKDSVFAMLNHERTHILWIAGEKVLESPIVVKNTIYTKGEEFIEVDVTDCRITKMEDNSDT